MENIDLIIQKIRKDFFIYRNGIIAENLRRTYPDNIKIFGLMVPQFIEISKKYPKNLNLGLTLWNDCSCRESRILSLYIIPPAELDKETVIEMIKGVRSIEEADFLAFKILRNTMFAKELYEEINKDLISDSCVNYCMKMYKKNIENL